MQQPSTQQKLSALVPKSDAVRPPSLLKELPTIQKRNKITHTKTTGRAKTSQTEKKS